MILIVGLGNPGKKYKYTRHNIGFLVLDKFLKNNLFSEFKASKKFNSLISKGSFGKKKIILVKPQSFMNLSGKTVKLLSKYYKINKKDVIVVHDDIDLSLGEIKIIKNRGAAGHKGVQSIIDEIKTKKIIRLRVGIRPASLKAKTLEAFVLQKFTEKEKKDINNIVKKCVKAIEVNLKNGLEKAMNEFN